MGGIIEPGEGEEGAMKGSIASPIAMGGTVSLPIRTGGGPVDAPVDILRC